MSHCGINNPFACFRQLTSDGIGNDKLCFGLLNFCVWTSSDKTLFVMVFQVLNFEMRSMIVVVIAVFVVVVVEPFILSNEFHWNWQFSMVFEACFIKIFTGKLANKRKFKLVITSGWKFCSNLFQNVEFQTNSWTGLKA